MYKDTKPLLTPEEQIEHLINKGVKFEYVSVCDAVDYLNKNNNYFKLRAYRKTFPKHPDGENKDKYINLDFAMLQDLSIIDMRLRYTFIHMALDIEHFSKLKLMRAVEQGGEDGYQIVLDYFSMLQADDEQKGTHEHDKLASEIIRNNLSPYCGGIIQKYTDDFPIWAFIEIISFGSFIKFYRFCALRLNNRDMMEDYYRFLAIKELRNASAHSNCIINDLSAKDSIHPLNRQISHAIPNGIISKDTRESKVRNERIRQMTTLLYSHANIVTSAGVLDHTKDNLVSIIGRMHRNINYYIENDTILTFFEFFRNIVDIFYK